MVIRRWFEKAAMAVLVAGAGAVVSPALDRTARSPSAAPRVGPVAESRAEPHAQRSLVAADVGAYRLVLPAVLRLSGTAPVVARPGRGYYDEPLLVTLTTATSGATIRYTLDGSPPTETHGTVFVAPVPVDRTTTLRAAAFGPGLPPSIITTHTYLFLADVVHQNDKDVLHRGFPMDWGKYPSDWRLAGQDVEAVYGMNPEIVAMHAGTIRDDLRSLPALSVVTSIDDMFGREGLYSNPLDEGRERAVSIELLNADGSPGFQADCGARIAGGWSRKADVTKKFSFSLRFRSSYGLKRLRFPLFPDSPVSSFDTLRLRASQADSFYYYADKGQYLHDQWGRDTQAAMGSLAAHGRYVHVYLNGLYWGLYNVAEEPTASFASDHLGGDEADWDVIKDGSLVDGAWRPEVEDGDDAAFREMVSIVEERAAPDASLPEDRQRYERMSELLDLDQHADYTLLQIFGANTDWPNKNWRLARNRALDGPFDTLIWDYEHLTALHDDPVRGFCIRDDRDPVTGDCGFAADTAGVLGLHGWLERFPEYGIRFADRAQIQLVGDGALSPENTASRYEARADEIDRAMVGESARWGVDAGQSRATYEQHRMWYDYWLRRGRVPQTQAMWREERDRLVTEYFPTRTQVVVDQLCRQGLFPRTPAPTISVSEQSQERLTTVTMSLGTEGCTDMVRDGTVYFTVDGSDPREPWTGEVAERARAYAQPVLLLNYARVRARTLAHAPGGPEWSAATEVSFGLPRVAVTEIMYNPAGGSDGEFLELRNLEADPVDLSGATITGAVTFTMPAGTLVAPGAYVVVASNPQVLRARYGDVDLVGAFDGKLDNAGETIVLRLAGGEVLVDLTYDDEGFWPLGPDRLGHSLVPSRLDADPNQPESWRASAFAGGSPGRGDPDPPYGPGRVVINEVMAFPGPRQEDAIELHNPSSFAIDISGWGLSDSKDALNAYVLPQGTVLAAGGYAAVYRDQFDADGKGYGLGSDGESIYLTSLDSSGLPTGYLHGVTYGAADEAASFGRIETPAGLEFSALSRPTFGVDDPDSVEEFRTGTGAPNAPARVGPVVINEIMYAPRSGAYEYVELLNRSDDWVPMFNEDAPERKWALTRGVRYEFPDGAWIAPHGFLVIAGVREVDFRRRHGIPSEIPVHGPFTGKLDDSAESVELARPSSKSGSEDIWILEDRLAYRSEAPWPSAAAGSGPSLERTHSDTHGNDPRNWSALSVDGTPGRSNLEPITVFVPWAMRWY